MKPRTYFYVLLVIALVILLVIINNIISTTDAELPTAPNAAANQVENTAPSTSGAVAPKPAAPKAASKAYSLHVLSSGKDVWYSSPSAENMIKLTNPPVGSSLSPNDMIAGLAKGPWYQAGVAPIIITDEKGSILAEGTIRAQGNWMTNESVPFIANIVIPAQASGSIGVIIIKNANPAGLPANDLSVETVFRFR